MPSSTSEVFKGASEGPSSAIGGAPSPCPSGFSATGVPPTLDSIAAARGTSHLRFHFPKDYPNHL
ncbi:UNVERIFIED_CONTAM: hypothetical protein Sradi_5757100 [Sesamum radiatum]|uniref:Uncharacterized protein n=1 Tax=Sesamum radiatum TaxID=300843 RepID=A0AAW2L3Y1_SESRA